MKYIEDYHRYKTLDSQCYAMLGCIREVARVCDLGGSIDEVVFVVERFSRDFGGV